MQNKPAGVWSAGFGWVKVLITQTLTHMQKRTLRVHIVNLFSFECTAAVRANQIWFLCAERWWGWVADKRQVKNKATQRVCWNWAVTSLRKQLKEFLKIFICFGIVKNLMLCVFFKPKCIKNVVVFLNVPICLHEGPAVHQNPWLAHTHTQRC